MPLQKYELAEDWYNNRLQQNNGDKHQTLIDLLEYGFYTRVDGTDTPQDYKLEDVDNKNFLFVIQTLTNFLQEMKDQLTSNSNQHSENVDRYNDQITRLQNELNRLNAEANKMMKLDGSVPATADFYGGNYKVINLANPSSDKDAVNKQWSLATITQARNNQLDDDTKNLFWRLDGTVPSTANQTLNGYKIINLANPIDNKDAVNKQYLTTVANNIRNMDLDLIKTDGTSLVTGSIYLDSHLFRNVKNPENPNDAMTKQYMEQETANRSLSPTLHANDLSLIPSPKDGSIAYARDDHFWYIFSKTATSGIAPSDGTTGKWVKPYKSEALPSALTVEYSLSSSNISVDASSSLYFGDIPTNISVNGDPYVHMVYTDEKVFVQFDLNLTINEGSNADWGGIINIPINIDWFAQFNQRFNSRVFERYVVRKSIATLLTHKENTPEVLFAPIYSEAPAYLGFYSSMNYPVDRQNNVYPIPQFHPDVTIAIEFVFDVVSRPA